MLLHLSWQGGGLDCRSRGDAAAVPAIECPGVAQPVGGDTGEAKRWGLSLVDLRASRRRKWDERQIEHVMLQSGGAWRVRS